MSAHGFEIFADVIAHSLQSVSLNGARGQVLAARGDRIAVSFPAPIGQKALKPENLKLAPPLPDLPDATEQIEAKEQFEKFQKSLRNGREGMSDSAFFDLAVELWEQFSPDMRHIVAAA